MEENSYYNAAELIALASSTAIFFAENFKDTDILKLKWTNK